MRLMELVAIYDDGREETVGVNPRSVDYVEAVAPDKVGRAYVGVAGRTYVVLQAPREIMNIIEGMEAAGDGE